MESEQTIIRVNKLKQIKKISKKLYVTIAENLIIDRATAGTRNKIAPPILINQHLPQKTYKESPGDGPTRLLKTIN